MKMEQSKKNFPKYLLQSLSHSVAFMFFNGAIVQTFLLLIGFSESEVYLYSTLVQLAQVVMMFVMIFVTDRIEKKRLVCAIANFLIIIPVAIFILGAANPMIVSKWYIILLFVTSIATHGGIGMYMVMTYCLPYKLIDIADYGKFTGLAGALGGCITFGLSSLHTVMVSNFDYLAATLWFFVLALISAILSGVLLLWMKDIPSDKNGIQPKASGFIEAFKNKDTYSLIIPNFTRGLATGIFNVMAVIAISSGIATPATATYLTIVTYLASFLSSVAFTYLYNKMPIERLLMISTLAISAVLPFAISGELILFLVLMFVALFFRIMVDNAIPTALVRIIPEAQIGAYNSVRMLIFTAAQAVATAIMMPMVSIVGYKGALVFAAIMQLFCGIGHYAVIRSHSAPLIRGGARRKRRPY